MTTVIFNMYFECESENHCTYINILVIIHSSYTYTCMSHKSCHCFTMHNTASTMSNPSFHVRQLTQLDLFNLQKSVVSLHYLVSCPCFHCTFAMFGVCTGIAEDWHIADGHGHSQALPSLHLFGWNT